MHVDVQTEIVIRRKPHEVASYVCDPTNAPCWYDNIRESYWVSEPRVTTGARAAFVAFFLGRRLAYTYEFLEYEIDKRLVMSTAEGPFPMTTEYDFDACEEAGVAATRMKLRNHGQPKGFSKFVAPLMVRAMRKANEKDLKTLKTLLESTQ